MATLYTHQSKNVWKTWLLIVLFVVVVMLLGYGAFLYFGSPLILLVAGVFAIVMNVGAYWYSDKIVMKMQRAKQLDPKQYPEVKNIVENLAITSGLPEPKLYVMEERAPNAFATGRNPEHAAIAVTTGLLQMLDRTELEGVLAHELSHIGNKDTLIQMMVVVLVGFVAMLADLFFYFSFFGGADDEMDPRFAIIFTILGFVLALLAPFIATLIQLAISRKREFLADASGALLTRHPEGLASALEKISGNVIPMKHANNATAHLFIASPFGKKKNGLKSKISRLFMTHPPAEERISALRSLGQ